jgi:fumarate reductase flavoprotein subunit
VAALASGAGPTIDWLADRYGLPFSVVSDFDYPGHSRRRMHGLPTRAGRELIDQLRTAVEAQEIPIVTERRVERLFSDDARTVLGAEAHRPDGGIETIGCKRLILACNGFGGNKDMVRDNMPAIADALYFGHPGNQGHAVRWGTELGAARAHLGAYQGHGNVAHPHGILITWAVITEGGVQVNTEGQRFWNESQGYSEAAQAVLSQPQGIAFAIFDSRIAGIARQFADFRDAEAQGAIKTADSIGDLAQKLSLPAAALEQTINAIPRSGTDSFGRRFGDRALSPPYCGVKVTGALFHTQGGLATDTQARVLDPSGAPLPNLFAAGGAACGVSGRADAGYLSGNGLLSAVVLGRLAGASTEGTAI